jgi:hypothetical protein
VKPIWVAVLEDGGVLVEGGNCPTWDDVPRGARIRRLEIRDLDGGATLVSLDGFARCYAATEAAARPGQSRGLPSAKIIGCVRADGLAQEIRLEFHFVARVPGRTEIPEAGLRLGA